MGTMRIKDLHKYATEAGVSVVPSCCGSAYADLGVFLLAKKIKDDYGESVRSATCYCKGGGTAVGASGGLTKTRAAMGGIDKAISKKMADPFSLGGFIPTVDRNGIKVVDIEQGTGKCTAKARSEDKDTNMTEVSEDKKLGVWRAPYVHSFFDTRVVRRSNALMADLGNAPYGTALNFMEYAMLPPEQASAAKRALKEGKEEEEDQLKSEGRDFKDGEGPSVEDFDAWSGFFLYAESASGNQVKCSFVGADGYFETARIATELALALKFSKDKLAFKGGVLTPAVCGGTTLVNRLISSGVKFKMGEWLEDSALAPPEIA